MKTGKFYLFAERHPQSDFNSFCADCNECATSSNWRGIINNLNIDETRKEILSEIYNTNFENYGGDNSLGIQIKRLIWAIDKKLLQQLNDPANKAKAVTLVSTLNKIKDNYQAEYSKIAEEIKLKEDKVKQQEFEKEQEKLQQQRREIEAKAKQDSLKKAKEIEAEIEKRKKEEDGDPKQQWVRRAFGVLLSIAIHLFMLGCIIMYGKEVYKLCTEKDSLYRFASVMLGLLVCFGAYSANMSLYHFLQKANVKFGENTFGQILIVVSFFVSGIGVSVAVKKMINSKEKEWYIPYVMLVFAPIALFYFLDLYLRTSVTLQPKFLVPNVALVAGMLYKIIFDKDRIQKIMGTSTSTNQNP